MTDIKEMHLVEILADLASSQSDLKTCQMALDLGLEDYQGHSIHARIIKNKVLIIMIIKEIRRRLDTEEFNLELDCMTNVITQLKSIVEQGGIYDN